MNIKVAPAEVYVEYDRGVRYNTNINLYENVEKNENFYNDKQWEGVNAPNLAKPVFNFLKPVVNYYVATLISDDIAIDIETEEAPEDEAGYDVVKIIKSTLNKIMEHTNMRYYNRRMLRSCAVDGDSAFFMWFDPDVDTGKPYKGDIKIDLIDNTNILFGNPSHSDVQSQPYIIIVYRTLLELVKEEAKSNGLDADAILSEEESNYINMQHDTDNSYATVMLKIWKEGGTVRMLKCTKDAYVKEPWDTGMTMYPVSYMTWEHVKNSYHGVAPITGKIQNQIFVNKLYAMSMTFAENQAFPKIIYNSQLLPEGWKGGAGAAVAVSGNPQEAIFANFQPAPTNGVAQALIDSTITQTKDLMGASAAALGNVKPDNTSAIIATQKAAAMPLDIQRMDFYNFIENTIRVFIDMMAAYYGVREFKYGDASAEVIGTYDYSQLRGLNMHLNIDIGQGSYWAELTQISTLDALMANHIIPDAVTYLEAVPDGYIKNKQKIIDRINELQGNLPGEQAVAEAGMPQEGLPPLDSTPAAQALNDSGGEEAPLSDEIPDDDLAELLTELKQLPEDKRLEIVDKLKVSDETKQMIMQMLNEGGSDNDGQMPEMPM